MRPSDPSLGRDLLTILHAETPAKVVFSAGAYMPARDKLQVELQNCSGWIAELQQQREQDQQQQKLQRDQLKMQERQISELQQLGVLQSRRCAGVLQPFDVGSIYIYIHIFLFFALGVYDFGVRF